MQRRLALHICLVAPNLVTIHYHLFPILEVRGVEPLSETESTELLRVYGAFDLG